MPGRSKNRRRHGGARRPAPPRELGDALRSRNLARRLAQPLGERIEEFSHIFPSLARRRLADRITAAGRLTVLLAAWGGLAAAPEERAQATQLLAAAVLLDPSGGFGWQALAQSGLERDVAARFQRAARSAAQRDAEPEVAMPPFPSTDLLLAHLLDVAARLRGHDVDVDAVRDAARGLVELQVDMLGDADLPGSEEQLVVTACAAWILDAPAARVTASVPGLLEGVLGAAAGRVVEEVGELRRADVDAETAFWAEVAGDEDDEDEGLDDLDAPQDGEDDGEDDDGETELPVAPMLGALDSRLRVIEDPGEGAHVAHALGSFLLISAAAGLSEDHVPLGLAGRVRAASWLAARALEEAPDLEHAYEELDVAPVVRRAAALLSAEAPSMPEPDSTVEQQLTRLDELVEHCRHPDVLPSGCPVVDGLAYAAAATEALHAGVALSAAGRVRCEFASALAVLDPSALAGYPELRAQAAAELRDLAAER